MDMTQLLQKVTLLMTQIFAIYHDQYNSVIGCWGNDHLHLKNITYQSVFPYFHPWACMNIFN